MTPPETLDCFPSLYTLRNKVCVFVCGKCHTATLLIGSYRLVSLPLLTPCCPLPPPSPARPALLVPLDSLVPMGSVSTAHVGASLSRSWISFFFGFLVLLGPPHFSFRRFPHGRLLIFLLLFFLVLLFTLAPFSSGS